ncbi:HemK family methyltransferase [Diaporthe helianthi]|uniref:HemK family methyltransferase n=1 Tax=Diaporthe helianthi TaxID=158607 RepID=A0A2P5IDP9_DIAHE|nr:HemK family methyltransferase [Diaporthe helianthi]
MPRITPGAIRQAYNISPHAATLLPACRDLPSTLNELRWIREHVEELQRGRPPSPIRTEHQLASLCRRRGKGEPLQYVLGSQPFGNLDLKCRTGVLIPRPEPEAYTTHLASLIKQGSLPGIGHNNNPQKALRILDLCTGTGCIALLLYSLLRNTTTVRQGNLHVTGVDISADAVRLARENLAHNITRGHVSEPEAPRQSVRFIKGDVFSDSLFSTGPAAAAADGVNGCDVMVCNPPYVSRWAFSHQTARSVRNYEPKIAQVPAVAYDSGRGAAAAVVSRPEDVFYARLLDIAARLRPRVMLFEVGDLGQALRVAEMALRHGELAGSGSGLSVEVWRDWPDAAPEEDEEVSAQVLQGSREVHIRGSGHGRSVFMQCS